MMKFGLKMSVLSDNSNGLVYYLKAYNDKIDSFGCIFPKAHAQ
jgi:hypothetical protein